MAYSGMPSHYPHWSYGKSYEKLKTLYDHGVSGLPYEMVINSDPALAYLMRDNTLLLQILTIAHVYGHNDFFKNNFTYSSTRAEYTIETVQGARAARAALRRGSLDRDREGRAHHGCRACVVAGSAGATSRFASSATTNRLERPLEAARPGRSVLAHPCRQDVRAQHPQGTLEPDEDLLLFIRDHNPFLPTGRRTC